MIILGTYFVKIINYIFRTDVQIFIQNCLSGLRFIWNKTCFETAVHQLTLVQIELSPDEPWSGRYAIKLRLYLERS